MEEKKDSAISGSIDYKNQPWWVKKFEAPPEKKEKILLDYPVYDELVEKGWDNLTEEEKKTTLEERRVIKSNRFLEYKLKKEDREVNYGQEDFRSIKEILKKSYSYKESDKKRAELFIKLNHDGIKIKDFFKDFIDKYLENDERVMNFLREVECERTQSSAKLLLSKQQQNVERRMKKRGNMMKKKFALLSADEIENIFDILDEELLSVENNPEDDDF